MANIILWNTIDSDTPIRSLGCYQLASWLRHNGYTVKVIDFCHLIPSQSLADITEKHIGTDTYAVGVSTTFWNKKLDRHMSPEPQWVIDARAIIDRRRPMKWLLGGALSSTILLLPWIRFHGYAEDSLLKWMDEQVSKRRLSRPFDIVTSVNTYAVDDFIQPAESLPLEIGRGCQFKCRFCSYPLIGKKKGTYIKELGLVREEFIRNYNEFGTTHYTFQDDTVNESAEKIQALADIVQGLPFALSWAGYNRLDLIGSQPNSIQWLKDSGMRSAYFGIESFHPEASRIVGKGWNGKHAQNFLLELKQRWGTDINWFLSFIVGLPGESSDDILSTHQWCIDNEMADWSFNPLFINNSDSKLFKSEFDKDHALYGYSFPDKNESGGWVGNGWSHKTAAALACKLSDESAQIAKTAAWWLAALSVYNVPYDTLMATRRVDLPWGQFKIQANEFINRYVTYQLTNRYV